VLSFQSTKCYPDAMKARLARGYQRIVEGYLAHAEAVAHERPDTHYWAYLLLHRMVERKPEKAWPFVVAVVKRTVDPEILNYVSADILEDILCVHGPELIDRVEELARTDNHFRFALWNVWGWSRMPKDIRERLDIAAAGDPYRPESAG
jgi:hypothetical protein